MSKHRPRRMLNSLTALALLVAAVTIAAALVGRSRFQAVRVTPGRQFAAEAAVDQSAWLLTAGWSTRRLEATVVESTTTTPNGQLDLSDAPLILLTALLPGGRYTVGAVSASPADSTPTGRYGR